jgi:putative oxidoreductase
MNTAIALTLLRIFAGTSFIYHGWPKMANWKQTFQWLMKEKFPLPVLCTIILVVSEVIGGILLIIGIFTQYVAAVLALIMLVAVGYHLKKNEGWKATELAFVLMGVCIALAIAGGGAWQLLG